MLAEIIARLEDQASGLKKVYGAASFADIQANLPKKQQQPAAYVVPVSGQAGGNALAMAVDQQVTERFGVVLAHGNFKDPRGKEASQELESLRDDVIGVLLGWPPAAGYEGCLFAGYRVIGFAHGIVWMLLEFTATHRVRKT